VIQNITGRSTGYIARVTFPFLLIMIGFVILLTVFLSIVSFPPSLLLS
jgi:TRAP-type C4-dicarboxylate transport system permease large subunit